MSAHAQFSDVRLGDIITIDGVKAIVYQVNEDGTHGMAMTIRCQRGIKDAWCNDKKLCTKLPTITNSENGMANTEALIRFAESRKALDRFPLFKWCKSLGEGWFIPSKSELEAFARFWHGGEDLTKEFDWDSDDDQASIVNEEKSKVQQINEKIMEAGGSPFKNFVFTSTLTDDNQVYVLTFASLTHTWSIAPQAIQSKIGKLGEGRAFHKF